MSDKSDGDCSSRPDAHDTLNRFLNSINVPLKTWCGCSRYGNHIVEAACPWREIGCRVEADGVFTSEMGMALSVGVADCAPVLLYEPRRQVAAVVHAGREGTLQNIAAAGVRALCARYGCDPASLRAAIGPCAGVCCYEVSPECAQKWQAAGLPLQVRRLYLQESNRIQLENAGLIRHNIEIVPHCTICGGLFFSYRAGEISNRNLVVMML